MSVTMVMNLATLGAGFAYPAFMTLQCIENGEKGAKDRWLKYWTVASLFFFFRVLFGSILSYLFIFTIVELLFVVLMAFQDQMLEEVYSRVKEHLPAVQVVILENVDRVKKTLTSQ
eukprot:TRINITY_DN4369_c0_g1_i2.p1 TRINITY_DN4369_c0_g1~~TRINITY_DN4369_c0_g1_i2.p1  ORF type:complete len:116 (+),score=24.87 TRINITY_DN4369_c0_g1_i2:34-381(+)